MTVTRCPGSGFKTEHYRSTHQIERYYTRCPFCRRGFSVNYDGRIRIHRGLPPRTDGGCPYTCTADCDFNCYFTLDRADCTNPPENQEEGD